MKPGIWGLLLAALVLLAGCGEKEEAPKRQVAFSILVPRPVQNQHTSYAEGVQVFTSEANRSAVSAMVVNHPIRSGREAIVAVAIENRSDKPIPLDWNGIEFFNPKNRIRLLSPDALCDYFRQPGHAKPVLGSNLFHGEMLARGVVAEKEERTPKEPTVRKLAEVYRALRKDLCFVELPRDTTLGPGDVTVGFLVLVMEAKHFGHPDAFMLKIPVNGDLHKLRYDFRPLE